MLRCDPRGRRELDRDHGGAAGDGGKPRPGSGDPERQVKCIYVAVGQKGSTTAQVRQALDDAGAMAYTTIVAAPASDPAGYKYIAPYTGSAIGQHSARYGSRASSAGASASGSAA